MKFIIFTDKNYNFRKPMSDGLAKHLKEIGHDVLVLYDGNFWLSKTPLWKILVTDIAKIFNNIKNGRKLYYTRFFNILNFKKRFYKEILNSDCIIVVDNCPNVFYCESISRLEDLRKVYKGPIVNYDLHYLPNQGWYGMIREKNIQNFGLERFDWYLPASLVTEYAIPTSIPKIYNNIGFDIQSENLYSQQDDFLAVLDFEHKGWEREREIQLTALKETNTKYICLKGKYTRDEIRAIYRKCNIFFTSVRESFSLPVLEVQHCGGLIATPYSNWLPAHFIDKNIYEKGNGSLGRNFLVYENDLETLKKMINHTKLTFNAANNILRFKEDYPFYYTINNDELNLFCKAIEKGCIHGNKHNEFASYNSMIDINDRVELR